MTMKSDGSEEVPVSFSSSRTPKKLYTPPTFHKLTLAEAKLRAKLLPGDTTADHLLHVIAELEEKAE
ncbi:MAG: hypothetical protein ABSA54_01090 [Terriglobales bacterium]|jgi:hypothetical protein